MPSRINVGFVGLSAAGWAANALGPSLLEPSVQTKYKLVAVSTTSEASAKASAEKYSAQAGNPVKAYHGSTSEIASDPDIDLVVVSVKAWKHKEAVLAVIEKKKDFFVEWPAGTGLKQALEMAEAAHKQGVKTFVGLQGRNSPVVKKVKELVTSGAIGTVRSTTFVGLVSGDFHFGPPNVRDVNVFTMDKANGVTTLGIVGGHNLDTLTYVLGSIATINATASTAYPTAVVIDADGNPTGQTLPAVTPDHYSISGLLESGALATIVWRVGYKSTPGRLQLLWEIDGEDGSIKIESESTSFINYQNPTAYLNGKKIEVEGGDEQGPLGILRGAWEAYADGNENQYANIDDAVRNHRVLDAIERSLEEGKTIVL